MPTLASLIKDCAQMVGAVLHEGIATAGSTTTLTDAVELAGLADDTLNTLRLYIYEGTAIGQERVITDHAGATGVLTFPTGTAPTTTSRYIVLQQGWTAQNLRTMLITALRLRRRFLLEPMVDESITLDNDPALTLAYTVPTGIAAIQKIFRESDVGSGLFTVPLPDDFWYLNRAATRQIAFELPAEDLYGFLLHGCKLRIIGQKYETEPDSDDDVVSVQTAGIVLMAAFISHLSRVASDPQNSRRHTASASMLIQEFQRVSQQDVTPVWPGSKVVDE